MPKKEQAQPNAWVALKQKLDEHVNGPDQRITLRLPGWLHQLLRQRADEERRSLNEQILYMLAHAAVHGSEVSLHEAAKRVWVAALPDKDLPGRYLVSGKAIDQLGDALNEYEGH